MRVDVGAPLGKMREHLRRPVGAVPRQPSERPVRAVHDAPVRDRRVLDARVQAVEALVVAERKIQRDSRSQYRPAGAAPGGQVPYHRAHPFPVGAVYVEQRLHRLAADGVVVDAQRIGDHVRYAAGGRRAVLGVRAARRQQRRGDARGTSRRRERPDQAVAPRRRPRIGPADQECRIPRIPYPHEALRGEDGRGGVRIAHGNERVYDRTLRHAAAHPRNRGAHRPRKLVVARGRFAQACGDCPRAPARVVFDQAPSQGPHGGNVVRLAHFGQHFAQSVGGKMADLPRVDRVQGPGRQRIVHCERPPRSAGGAEYPSRRRRAPARRGPYA